MTERIRALLDEAVAGVGPRSPDPVPEVLRRGRARRRRLAVAGTAAAVAVAVFAVGGIVAANRGTSGKTPASRPSSEHFEATVSGGYVRTGGLAVPIPPGWPVIQDKRLTYCEVPANVFLVNVAMTDAPCGPTRHAFVGPWRPYGTPASVAELALINEVVLPGGQPLWLSGNELANVRAAPSASVNAPWAAASISIRGQRPQVEALLRGITANPVPPARLTLPETSPAVQLSVSAEKQLTSADPAVIEQVRALLAALDQPVRPGELPCPGATKVTGTWKLAGTDMAALTFTDPIGHLASAEVAISAGDTCAFATSSLGGRVHLPAGFLGRVEQLLGGR
ncbi:hypothetical protein AB0C12_10335 [Actinoplanes sp. NPDC048967]|uniref:hypothetical protein n=1 Tax=Actinoplanes sp. NPDC048967 TaxID=3155269 RepID=UPI0033EA5B35